MASFSSSPLSLYWYLLLISLTFPIELRTCFKMHMLAEVKAYLITRWVF
jgi:hypothetical protein